MESQNSLDIKQIVGQNIKSLRKKNNMSQQALASLVGYTAKAVSKWEIGKSIPEIEVLMKIAELFHVTVDYLLHADSEANIDKYLVPKTKDHNHLLSTLLLVSVVWVIATIIFVYSLQRHPENPYHFIYFCWAIPASMLIIIISYRHKERKRISIYLSILLWTFIACVYLEFLFHGMNFYLIFAVGIPTQIAIFVWSKIIKIK